MTLREEVAKILETAKMAILNNRNWIGSEISKEYCEIAEKRINENL